MQLPSHKIQLLLVVILLCASGFASERPWREIRSPHFRVITNGNEGAARHVAREFEQMRAVFADEFPGYRLDSAERLLIVAPEDEPAARKLLPEMWKHSGPKPAGVYFHAWEQPYAMVRLDQVRSDLTMDEFAVVYHEYVHSLLHLNLHWLPTWLDEGLADYFATSRLANDKLDVGNIDLNTYPVWWIDNLATSSNLTENIKNGSVIPLRAIITDHGGPSMDQQFNLYYLHWWTLTHFLFESEKYHARAVQLAQEGGGLEDFETLIGPVDQIQIEWHDYVRQMKAGLMGKNVKFFKSKKVPKPVVSSGKS